MAVKTFNQLSDADKVRARQAAQDRFLMYLHTNGIPLEREVWPKDPPLPFTKLPNSLELNRLVQELQGSAGAIYWIGNFMADPVLAPAMAEELDMIVLDLRFRTEDTPADDVLPLS
jgi:hypothetical protein